MRLFLFLILFCFSSPSLAKPHSSSDQTVLDIDSAKQAVWRVYSTNSPGIGTGFFIGPNQFITNLHTISDLLEISKIEDLALSHDDFPPLKVEKVLALSFLYDLVLLEIKTEKSPPPLKLRENLSGVNEDLVILGYPYGKWEQMNKAGEFLPSTFKQISVFPINHSELSGASGSPVLDKRGQVVGVVYQASSNILFMINLTPLKRFISGEERQNCNNLSVEECMKKSLDNLKEQAEQGDALAQYHLALFYLEAENKEQAFLWMEKVAKQGYASAQFELAYHFYKDKDLEQDFFWLEKAAEQGHVLAQHNLATLYFNNKDFKQAAFWMMKSAEQGLVPAQHKICTIQDYMDQTSLLEQIIDWAVSYFKDEERILDQIVRFCS